MEIRCPCFRLELRVSKQGLPSDGMAIPSLESRERCAKAAVTDVVTMRLSKNMRMVLIQTESVQCLPFDLVAVGVLDVDLGRLNDRALIRGAFAIRCFGDACVVQVVCALVSIARVEAIVVDVVVADQQEA